MPEIPEGEFPDNLIKGKINGKLLNYLAYVAVFAAVWYVRASYVSQESYVSDRKQDVAERKIQVDAEDAHSAMIIKGQQEILLQMKEVTTTMVFNADKEKETRKVIDDFEGRLRELEKHDRWQAH